MTEIRRGDWELSGDSGMTEAQRRMLNAVCGDLAEQLPWHGFSLSKDDYRHMLSGTILGWRTFPGVDRGEGAPGFIMLGGSSLDLSREQAALAITCGIHIGDHPEAQHLRHSKVQWCEKVLLGLGYRPGELAA